MTAPPCVTIDVEDFHDGMAELGYPQEGGGGIRLGDLMETLAQLPADRPNRLTFFVVGKFAEACRTDLVELAKAGHEIASHGPDHGQLPEASSLEEWLRSGKKMVEDIVQTEVTGLRMPRFDVPKSMTLEAFRDVMGSAGFTYVSDERTVSTGTSAVIDLPVTRAMGIRLGGGSYQRFLPMRVLRSVLPRCPQPAVLYYHSYDFSCGALPPLSSARSVTEVRQLALRRRIQPIFVDIVQRFGSRSCSEAVHEIRSVL